MIYDNHGRPINYLRLSVTDRCNLRCFYCMPEDGINYLPKKELLTYEEMFRLVKIMSDLGVSKIRITGGEPFVRRELMSFLWKISELGGVEQIHITTNGVLTAPLVPELKQIGIKSVNLSLDTLDRENFRKITRRDELPKVLDCLEQLLKHNIAVKINAVVMEGKNIDDLIPLAELSKNAPIDVRFIEEMPFNGEGNHYPTLFWTYRRILDLLKSHYPDMYKIADSPNSTSYNYQIPHYQGTIGVIAAFTRTFCGTCNRIRVTAQGILKTCLYDDGVLDIKKLMREEADDQAVTHALLHAFKHRAKDGYEAEQKRQSHAPVTESMSTIGG
ncbi:GTP 3',8-cyclase MoaA [Thermoflexibacter ruber]|uniref:GTP 3',8-cyclase n=1 Tax=Thermoflexibacter ruber TaxID=1003 RepID=A0A1I2GA26_9BACT|nr:GTP 3',8-cyclase MoaA [Thermoflexibacter ruber]SFF14048.1 cyclic pyranopterin monophosphate synthase subunit MoaA [Thermoflexibacter ruber]